MFCRDKSRGTVSLRHSWHKKVQKYPYIDILKVQVIREVARCTRCGKVKISIVNLSSNRVKKDIFREDLWVDM